MPPKRSHLFFIVGIAVCSVGAGVYGVKRSMLNDDGFYTLKDAGPFGAAYVLTDDRYQTVKTTLLYPSGEVNNPHGEGLAHYVEHLAWQAIRDSSDDFGRNSNAWTNLFSTGYWVTRPPEELADTLNDLAMTAAPLGASESEATKERDIVQREYDQRERENHARPVWREMTAELFEETGLGRATIGTPDSIAEFDLETARRLHAGSHHLDRATLLVRGPVEGADVQRALSIMAPVPEARAPWSDATNLRPQHRPRTDTATATAEGHESPLVIQRRYVPYPDDVTDAENDIYRQLLDKVIDSSKPGGIARALRFDDFILRSYDFKVRALPDAGHELWIIAVPDADVSLEAAEQALTETLTDALLNLNRDAFDDARDDLQDDIYDEAPEDIAKDDFKNISASLSQGLVPVSTKARAKALNQTTYEDVAHFATRFVDDAAIVTRLISNQ